MALVVPDAGRKPLATALGLSSEQQDAIVAALRKAPIALQVTDLVTEVAQQSSVPPGELSEILSLLASLYSVRFESEMPMAEFVDSLLQAAASTGRPELQADAATGDRFRWFLTEVLSLDQSLGVTSKVVDVMNQHQRVFLNARVVSDLRPVFSADVDRNPSAAVMIHLLKIHYREGDRRRDFFVALDTFDLGKLKAVLERATRKEATLKRVAKDANVLIVPRSDK